MLLPRHWAPLRAASAAVKTSKQSLTPSNRALQALRNAALAPLSLTFVRHATHQSEGRANGAKDGAGRRLGAKKTGEEWVIPGNIIFRQRGTNWHPGDNVGMGRDHTLFALEPGYVKYYRNPRLHPTRRYIGVVFNRNDTLPYPPHAARKRRLGMLALQMRPHPNANTSTSTLPPASGTDALSGVVESSKTTPGSREKIVKRPGFNDRQSNYEIGKLSERAAATVRKFVPGDRFAAWRKSRARIEENQRAKDVKGKKGSSKKRKASKNQQKNQRGR